MENSIVILSNLQNRVSGPSCFSVFSSFYLNKTIRPINNVKCRVSSPNQIRDIQ